MSARRQGRSFTLEALEGRITLSSANASPDAAVGQALSSVSQQLNAYPDNGKEYVEDTLGFKNRGQLYSESTQAYHQSV